MVLMNVNLKAIPAKIVGFLIKKKRFLFNHGVLHFSLNTQEFYVPLSFYHVKINIRTWAFIICTVCPRSFFQFS